MLSGRRSNSIESRLHNVQSGFLLDDEVLIEPTVRLGLQSAQSRRNLVAPDPIISKMTPSYLPHSFGSRDPSSSSSTSPTPHYRKFSTASTLSPGLSESSNPTEPLLPSNVASKSFAHPDSDLLSQRPAYPSDTRRGWVGGPSFDGEPIIPMAGSSHRDRAIGPRLHWWLRLVKGLLEAVIGECNSRCSACKDLLTVFFIAGWAAYNATRYFLAFKNYQTKDGQLVSLVLGISTSAAFACSLCASVSSVLQPHLTVHYISTRSLWLFRVLLRSLASSLLIGPAAVNVALLFIWHNSRMNVRQYCHIDLDVLWSTFDADCKPSPWSLWLAVSLVRLVLTLCILVCSTFFFFFSYTQGLLDFIPYDRVRLLSAP